MTQLLEQIAFEKQVKSMSDWCLPDSEVVRRISLIDDLNSGDRIFKLEAIKKAMRLIPIMVYLKPITDEMLIDYSSAMFSMCDYLEFKRDRDAERYNDLVGPAIKVLRDFLCSKGWQDFIIEKETTGQGVLVINGATIPISKEELKLQTRRMGIFPMFPFISIDKIKVKQKEYYSKLYGNDQKTTESSCGVFQPKINEQIIPELHQILKGFFDPEDQFENFLKGNQITGKINFKGRQNLLAGIFIRLKEDEDIQLGTHQQTYDFIKQYFLIKGRPIETKQILSYLKEPKKANPEKFIDISV